MLVQQVLLPAEPDFVFTMTALGRGSFFGGKASAHHLQTRTVSNCRHPQPALASLKRGVNTLSPFALLIALRGLKTLRTLRIFTTEMALDLREDRGKGKKANGTSQGRMGAWTSVTSCGHLFNDIT